MGKSEFRWKEKQKKTISWGDHRPEISGSGQRAKDKANQQNPDHQAGQKAEQDGQHQRQTFRNKVKINNYRIMLL